MFLILRQALRLSRRARRLLRLLPRPLPEGRRAAFRSWRRTRPFWGGLLLMLGGAELILVPMSPLTVLVSLGLGGLAAIGIGLALVVAGLFLWFLPHTRHYVSIHALILSVLSFAATNLGGFLIGMLLGILGSAMGFGWTPVTEQDHVTERFPSDLEESAEAAQPSPLRDRAGPRALAVVLPLVLLAATAGPAGAPVRAPAARSIPVASTPPIVSTTRFAPEGLTLAGVSEVPTRKGPLKVMVLKMRAASLTDYRLRTRDGGDELSLGADTLDLSGDVTLYLTRISGCLQGVVCLTFTPDTLPVPPVVPPFVYMTDVHAEQALVTSDLIAADGLTLRTAAS
ncbi:DUF6114 domain-containing protein [Streptomyces sp. KR80]|uniref:DUF6114 domain-containing protein n=1 Tax=Streptomyces sp. KR80 TaxID=3457426 RepID=UPI003FD0BFA9